MKIEGNLGYSWVELLPQKISWNPKCPWLWIWPYLDIAFADIIQIRYVSRVGPNLLSLKKRKCHVKTEVPREKVTNGHGGSGQSDVAASRGKSRIVGYHQKLGWEKEGFYPEFLMERGPVNTLISDFGLPEALEPTFYCGFFVCLFFLFFSCF